MNRHVLVVEDSATIHNLICGALQPKGFYTIRADGYIQPVINTRSTFTMSPFADTISTSILVMDSKMGEDSLTIGALVDAVQTVVEISADQIQPVSRVGSRYNAGPLNGMVTIPNPFIMLSKIDQAFSATGLFQVQKTGSDSWEQGFQSKSDAFYTNRSLHHISFITLIYFNYICS